jgi:hypothetical protein
MVDVDKIGLNWREFLAEFIKFVLRDDEKLLLDCGKEGEFG